MKPIVAIVGRPNVGKSTFFNKISGKRISIVEDTPGVTRDRIYTDVEWLGYHFTMIDTGGIEPNTEDIILSQMREQARIAIETADVILFMVDGKNPLTSDDLEIAQMLRRADRPIMLVANKIDAKQLPDHFYDFYQLGLGEPIAISAANGLNLGDLLDDIIAHFKGRRFEEEDNNITKIAVIGKPNVGKSSLVNKLLGEERVIVSDIPGTTREAIDSYFKHDGEKFVIIDTAGIRRQSRIDDNVERYSVMRSITAVERADVCLLILDAEHGITEQDKKVAGYAHEAGKGLIIVVNKWDLVEKDNSTVKSFEKLIRNELVFIPYAPILYISVKTGQRVHKIMELVRYVREQCALRITTGTLNDIISEAILMNQPPSDKGKRLKIYYMTQVDVKPPKFLLFVNYQELAHFSYVRYLENTIRKQFKFEGTPIVIDVRQKGGDL